MFSGSIPALVTPFREGRFEESVYRAFVAWQIDEGSHGLVPCGTTGEAATLSDAEHRRAIRICVEESAGRVPVIAGCGANDTARAIALSRSAQDAGADAILHVPPYYNRPGQAGIVAHFRAIAKAVTIPILLYNVPARTVTDIAVETMKILARHARIIGVKDATGNLARVTEQRRACGPDFVQLSGTDDMALGFMAMGGRGCISVTANVAPLLCAEFQRFCLEGQWEAALDLQDRLFPLHTALFSDASPAPVKYAMSRVRPNFPGELRLPMVPASPKSRRAVDIALAAAGLA